MPYLYLMCLYETSVKARKQSNDLLDIRVDRFERHPVTREWGMGNGVPRDQSQIKHGPWALDPKAQSPCVDCDHSMACQARAPHTPSKADTQAPQRAARSLRLAKSVRTREC